MRDDTRHSSTASTIDRMSANRLKAIVRNVTPRFDGFLKINEYEIEQETHRGGTMTVRRLVMERGHAVGVLGYDAARDEVVLANELRPGMLAAGEYPFGDALVAGGIGPDETAFDAAVREMKEEADLDLRDPILMHAGAYVSPGGTSEKIALVCGLVDTSQAGGVHGNPGEDEDIRTVVLRGDDFIARAKRGDITDMKTVLAAWWLEQERGRLLKAAPDQRSGE